MAVGRARTLQPVKSVTIQPVKRVLVIGGGVAGMNAALQSANEGFEVTLVEKEAMLGGSMLGTFTMADGSDPQAYLQDLVERSIEWQDNGAVESNQESTTGSVGGFRQDPAGRREQQMTEHGAIILATAAKSRPDKVQARQSERVLTVGRLRETDSR